MGEDLIKNLLIEQLAPYLYETYCIGVKRCLGLSFQQATDITKKAKDKIKSRKEERANKKKEKEEAQNAKLTEKERERLVIKEPEETKIDGKTVDEIAEENCENAVKENSEIQNYSEKLLDDIKGKMKEKEEEIFSDIKELTTGIINIIKDSGEVIVKLVQIPNAAIATGPTGVTMSAGTVVKGFGDLKTSCDTLATEIDKVRVILSKYLNEVKKIQSYFKNVEDNEDVTNVNDKVDKITEIIKKINTGLSVAQAAIGIIGSIPKFSGGSADNIDNLGSENKTEAEIEEDKKITENAITADDITPPSPIYCSGCTNVEILVGQLSEEEFEIYNKYIVGTETPTEEIKNSEIYKYLDSAYNKHICENKNCTFCFREENILDDWKVNDEDSEAMKQVKEGVYKEWQDKNSKCGTFCKKNTNR